MVAATIVRAGRCSRQETATKLRSLRSVAVGQDLTLAPSISTVHAAQKPAPQPYFVVVLDRDLPGVHGDAICRQIVADGLEVRVLMLTAAATVKDGLGLGADDYLPKPFDFSELVARVRALGRRSAPPVPPPFPTRT